KQGIITQSASNPEMQAGQRQQIEADLAELQRLLEDNKARIDQLSRRLNADSREMKSLRELVATLQQQLQDKDMEIMQLEQQLASLNFRIDQVTRSRDSLGQVAYQRQEVIERQTEEINRVLYALGTFRELHDSNGIDAGGRFKTKSGARIKEAFNQAYFTAADMRQFTELRLNSKKARLATTHPSSSYELIQGADKRYEK